MADTKGKVEDPTMVLSNIQVAKARADSSGKQYRVYCDGIFDLTHLGHMNMLQQAKRALGAPEKTYLLVGVCSDELTHKFKGKTVMDHKTRCSTIALIKGVDQVVPEAPWVLTQEFLDKYEIDFVAHDAIPYTIGSGAADDVYAFVKEKGMFLETQRTDGISTSDLIVTLVRDYDAYVMRNLDRGYSKKDLNVGNTWEVRKKIHDKKKKLDDAVGETKAHWKDLSDSVKGFMKQFNKNVKNNLKDVPNVAVKVGKSSGGLLWRVFNVLKFFLSYINPFGYGHQMKLVIMILLGVLWNYNVYMLGKAAGGPTHTY